MSERDLDALKRALNELSIDDLKALGAWVNARLDMLCRSAPELSERESQVVRLIALGYYNTAIAPLIGASVKTVETYKMRAMRKLGITSRVELVRYAIARGWFAPSEVNHGT